MNGHFSDFTFLLSATCKPWQVYGHFSDFTKSGRSPAEVCRWMAINLLCHQPANLGRWAATFRILQVSHLKCMIGWFWFRFSVWDNCTLLGSWPAIIPWEYKVWRMNKSCCFVLQYNTEAMVLVLQYCFEKRAIPQQYRKICLIKPRAQLMRAYQKDLWKKLNFKLKLMCKT